MSTLQNNECKREVTICKWDLCLQATRGATRKKTKCVSRRRPQPKKQAPPSRMRAKDPALAFDVAAGATPCRMRAEQRLQERSRNLRVRSLSASDLRRDAEEDEACLPSTAATQEPQRENKKKENNQDASSITQQYLSAAEGKNPSPFYVATRATPCRMRAEQRVQEKSQQVMTIIVASRPLSLNGHNHFRLRGWSPLRSSSSSLRPPAVGLRPPASGLGFRPPTSGFRQFDTAAKVDMIRFCCKQA